jgi:hypothetical protein
VGRYSDNERLWHPEGRRLLRRRLRRYYFAIYAQNSWLLRAFYVPVTASFVNVSDLLRFCIHQSHFRPRIASHARRNCFLFHLTIEWHDMAACTYSHFEKSSNCPTCGKGLTESDFREVNVVEASKTHPTDTVQASYQTLFTRLSSKMAGALPLSDLCYGAIKQLDASKQTMKFVLKQLLLDSTNSKKRFVALQRSNEHLKKEATKWKQSHSTEKLQMEKMNGELQQRLQSRESTIRELNNKIAEQGRMLDQFRKIHNNGGPGAGSSSSSANNLGRRDGEARGRPMSNSHRGGSRTLPQFSGSGGGDPSQQQQQHPQPPLKGFMMQKEARNQQKQDSYAASRQPRILFGRPTTSGGGGAMAGHTPDSANLMMPPSGGGGGQHQHQHHGAPLHHVNMSQQAQRPFSTMSSNGSTASLSHTPRIRDLSSRSAMVFSSAGHPGSNHMSQHNHASNKPMGGGGGGGHMNKRRRISTSPTTAFARSYGGGGFMSGR